MTCIQGNRNRREKFSFFLTLLLTLLLLLPFSSRPLLLHSWNIQQDTSFRIRTFFCYRVKGRNVIVMPTQIYGLAAKKPPSLSPRSVQKALALVLMMEGVSTIFCAIVVAGDGSACPATIPPDWKQHPLRVCVRHTAKWGNPLNMIMSERQLSPCVGGSEE